MVHPIVLGDGTKRLFAGAPRRTLALAGTLALPNGVVVNTYRPAASASLNVTPVVELDVAWIAPADLDAVDALARLQLAAARRGIRLRLRHPSSDLRDLLHLVGLEAVFAPNGEGGAVGGGTERSARGTSRADSAERS